MANAQATLQIPVELFGTARLRSGQHEVTLELPAEATRRQVVHALALACPALVGNAIREDLAGLEDGYAFNRNGTAFLSGEVLSLRPGDSLLVLSSQAGG